MSNKVRMILIAAPSGAGKSSFLDRILTEVDGLVDICTYTTRSKRTNESEGDPYHFVSREDFETMISQDFFLEWAEVHNNLYGTPRNYVEDAFDKSKVVVIDIDIQGVKSLKKHYPDAVSLFILPPSIEELRTRILERDKKVPSNLELRLENARKEMEHAQDFDLRLVNDDFEKSYAEFKKMVEDLLVNGLV